MEQKKAMNGAQQRHQQQQRGNLLHLAGVLVFLAALSAPSIGLAVFGYSRDRHDALEAGATIRPCNSETLRDGSFVRDLKQYFSQRFYFRRQLIRLASHVSLMLGTSFNSDVIPGSGGWLFFGDDAERKCMTGRYPFPEAELEEWQSFLDEVQRRAARRGAKFVYFVAPDKHSIYAEELPESFKAANALAPRLDQIAARLKTRTAVPFVDPRPALLGAKGQAPLYYKTDTHWNSIGAYVGYSALSDWIAEQLHLPRKERWAGYTFGEGTLEGDLGRILGVAAYFTEATPVLRSTGAQGCDLTDLERRELEIDGGQLTTHCPSAALGKILFFRDSFGTAMAPYLAREAREVNFLWQALPDLELIEREQPDLVIFEMVERHLMRPDGWLKGARPR